MPVIKISSIKDLTRTSAKGKKYKVTEVIGEKYGTGDEWKTDIFKNNTEVLEQLEEFGVGETANFEFKKNGNFYDLVAITTPSEENLEYAKKNASAPSGGPAKGGGYSNKKWDGRTGAAYDRSASVYLAFDILKSAETEANLRKKGSEGLMKEVIEMADILNDYIHDGDNVFEAPEEGDGLDPI
jgi:hypothetical protein